MRTIWKYALPIQDEVRVRIPGGGGLFLALQMQGGAPCLWVAVDTDQPPREMLILWRGTGHRLDGNEGTHLGTVQTGNLVFHAFLAMVGHGPRTVRFVGP